MGILVTGAAGFIGMHVARALLARGDEVVGVDNINDYYGVRLKTARLASLQCEAAFRFEGGDVADTSAVAEWFAREGFDRVEHSAAQAGVRYSLWREYQDAVRGDGSGRPSGELVCRHEEGQ